MKLHNLLIQKLFPIELPKQTITRVLALAWPVSLQSVLAASLGMIDIMMVGHLGEQSVAAMGLATRIQFVLLVIGSAFGVGAGILIAQYVGAKKFDAVSGIIAQILVVATAIMLPMIFLTSGFAQQFSAMGSDEQLVISLSTSYLHIALPSLLLVLVFQIFEGGLRGFGQVKVALYFAMGAMLLNVGLNDIFINGRFELPAMGVDGAAWATAISRFLLLAGLLGWLIVQKHTCLPRGKYMQFAQPVCSWRKIISINLPMALNFGVWAAGTFIYQIIFGSLGTQSLAVMGMLSPIEGTLISMFMGFATAASILVGQKLGESEMEAARQYGKNLTISITVLAFMVGLIVVMAKSVILMPFSDYHPETLQLAEQVLIIMAFGMALKTLNMMLSLGVLRAGGDNKYCLMSDTVAMWLISIPLTWLIAGQTGVLIWVFIATYSEEITKNILFFTRMMKGKWLRNLTESDVNETAKDMQCQQA